MVIVFQNRDCGSAFSLGGGRMTWFKGIIFSGHKSNVCMYVCMYVSLNTINFFNAACNLLLCFEIKTKKKQNRKQTNLHFNQSWTSICLLFFCLFFLVWIPKQKGKVQTTLKKWLCFPDVIDFFAQHVQHQLEKDKLCNGGPWKVGPCLLSHTSGYHPTVHVLLIFSWFGHPPRKLLKTMGENTTQPRLEYIISKQISAWPLAFLFKPSNICLMQ